jgi:hypothetical protein
VEGDHGVVLEVNGGEELLLLGIELVFVGEVLVF